VIVGRVLIRNNSPASRSSRSLAMSEPAGKPPQNLMSHSYTSWFTASTSSAGSSRSCSANSSEDSRAKAPSV